MNFKLDKEGIDTLLKIFNRHDKNLDSLEYIREYLNNPYPLFDKSKVDKDPINYRFEIINNWSGDNKDFSSFLSRSLRYKDVEEFINNPYYLLLKDVCFDNKDWKLETKTIPAYEIFICGNNYTNGSDYCLTTPMGYFSEDYVYPSLSLYGNEWMSLNPNEIKTMEVPIALCQKKVLVLGLGLGYFAYMVSNKKEVDEVHVVEMDKDLINLFNEYLLPKFPHKEKIHIHKADAFEFIKDVKDGDYHDIFSDLWHDVSDGLDMYLRLKKCFSDFTKTHCQYWIEDSLITYYRMLLIWIIGDEYQNQIIPYDDMQEDLQKKLSSMTITSKEDIGNLFNIRGLFSLMNK